MSAPSIAARSAGKRRARGAACAAAAALLAAVALIPAVNLPVRLQFADLPATEALARAYPGSALAQRRLGERLLAAGRAQEAFGAFDRAAMLAPGDADALVGKAEALLALNRAGEAEGAVRQAVRLAPRSAPGHRTLGEVLFPHRGDAAAAIPEFEAATRLDPRDGRAWKGLARAHAELFHTDQAISALRRAAACDPADADPLFSLVQIDIYQGRADEARATLDRALTLKPEDPLGQSLLGQVLMMGPLDDTGYQQARAAFQEALARVPEEPDILYRFATLEERTRHYDASASLYRRILVHHPDHRVAPVALFHLGQVLLHQGHRDEGTKALALYAKVQTLVAHGPPAPAGADAPEDMEDISLPLARLYRASKRPDLARVAYDHYLAHHPDDLSAARESDSLAAGP